MRIICLHQSSELYGSDRSFLQVIKFFKSSGLYSEITIILPRPGPLVEEITSLGLQVIFQDLSLLSKTYLKSFQWGKIIYPLFLFKDKIKLYSSYDVVYVNTSVILDFYFFAPFIKSKKVIHIREIPTKWLSKILTFLIRQSDSTVIFNSNSTKESFGRLNNSIVVHNAFEGYSSSIPEIQLKSPDSPLRILLIGRINMWKGQDFTIEALSRLTTRNFELKIVGSTFTGNENILNQLQDMVKSRSLEGNVEFVDFVSNTHEIYSWADVVIVPSKKPEPFGRIAIEAMSLGKAVIAANHGGLPEIVENNVSGFLFIPNNIEDFNRCIMAYVDNKSLLNEHGQKSFNLYQERFSLSNMYNKLSIIFKNL